uniref:DIS3-like exonuclease 2 isoform X2 n=1 Tax=Dermatophagoides pteronyssinus TaxID=6956 RepID=A0A6P6XWP1_DERPT|nr:DIS3-like exonuclease 2 isoform X2 [Dermatophagoides pteronyssinus]
MPNHNDQIECLTSSSSSSLMSDIHKNKNSTINHKNRIKNTNGLKRGNSGDSSIITNDNNGRSKIPVYNGNNHSDMATNSRNCTNVLAINNLFGWNIGYHHHHHHYQHHQQSQRLITNLNNLRIMDLPEHVRIHQNLHNRLNHPQRHYCQQQQQQAVRYCQHKYRPKEFVRSLPSTPGSSTPKVTPEDESTNSIMSSSTTTAATTSTMMTNTSKNSSRKKRMTNFEEYLPLCEMQKGLQKGEIVEGILRINQRNYNDAYISAPDEGLDIYIKGLIYRNKALNGDLVAVKFLNETEWKISYTAINANWEEWKDDFTRLIEANDDEIDLNKLKLNSKDMGLISMGSKSTSSPVTIETSKQLLMDEFENLPLQIFTLKISDLKKQIPYWSRFIQRTAKVVGIVKQNHPRMFAGSLKFEENNENNKNANQKKKMENDNKYVKFTSCDIRNPQIIIPMQTLPEIIQKDYWKYKNHLFLAEITDWKSDSLYPLGKIIKNFGEMGDVDVETEIMLISLSINKDDFPEEALAEYQDKFPDKDWLIPEGEINQRKDLRKECIFTIDPETARDLDDAISYRQLSDDRFEIGIHIADVSYFIKENTLLDRIASDRATSVYLVSKVIPMLPHIFCQDLCSLNPGHDKLTFSAIITVNGDGEVVDRWFGRTVINSCCKLTYEFAQKLIECDDDSQLDQSIFPHIHDEWSLSDIWQRVRRLQTIAKTLRKKRQENGSIRLDKTKVTFLLNEEGMPLALSKYQLRESNWLIEELMLIANKCVAEFLYDKFAPEGRAFLRWHPPLDKFLLREFLKSIKGICPIEFKSECSRSMVESLEKLAAIDSNFCRMSTMFLIKAMKLAMYICVSDQDNPLSYRHFALNFSKYTHFTSPIRRYADIMVHRLLSMALGYESSICSKTNEELKKIAENCNTKKYNAMLASEKSTEIYLKAYISKIGSLTSKAIVFQVYDHSFDVLTLTFDTINRIYLDQLYIDDYEFIRDNSKRELKLKWKSVETQSTPDTDSENLTDSSSNLIQTIESFIVLDIEMVVTDKFELKVIIAHPSGKFIYNSK